VFNIQVSVFNVQVSASMCFFLTPDTSIEACNLYRQSH